MAILSGKLIPGPQMHFFWSQILPFQAEKLALFFNSLHYTLAPLPHYLEDMEEEGGEKKKVSLIHIVEIKNFHLSDALEGIFTFLLFLLPSSIHLCLTILSSWWTSSILEEVAALETAETNQGSEKQPWKVIKSTASSCQMPEPKVLFTAACLKQYSGCQNKSKIQDYRQACYVGGSFAHQATTDPWTDEKE